MTDKDKDDEPEKGIFVLNDARIVEINKIFNSTPRLFLAFILHADDNPTQKGIADKMGIASTNIQYKQQSLQQKLHFSYLRYGKEPIVQLAKAYLDYADTTLEEIFEKITGENLRE